MAWSEPNAMHCSTHRGIVWVSCQKECVIWKRIILGDIVATPVKQITAQSRLPEQLWGWPVKIKIFVQRFGRETAYR